MASLSFRRRPESRAQRTRRPGAPRNGCSSDHAARLRRIARRLGPFDAHAVARGGHLGQDGDGDLGRRARADVQADRAVQPRELRLADAEVLGQALLRRACCCGASRWRRCRTRRDFSASISARSSSLGSCVSATTAVWPSGRNRAPCRRAWCARARRRRDPARRGIPRAGRRSSRRSRAPAPCAPGTA